MKKLLLIALLLCLSAPAMAEGDVKAETSIKHEKAEGQKERRARSSDEEMSPAKFEAQKAKLLQRVNDRIAKLEKHKACVTAAAKPGDLQACRPERSDRSSHDEMRRRMDKVPGLREKRGLREGAETTKPEAAGAGE